MAFELTIHTIDNRPGFMLVIASRATCSHLVYSHLGLLRVVHFTIVLFPLYIVCFTARFWKPGLKIFRLLPYFPAARQGA